MLDHSTGTISPGYSEVLSTNEISIDYLNSNGNVLWLSAFVRIFLQAYQTQIVTINLENIKIRFYFETI